MKYLSIWSPYYFLVIASACLISACSSSGTLSDFSNPEKSNEVDYSIIYIIHGDADYLYHDSLGTAHQADKEVLAEAVRVGEQAVNGEVLIFHQRPESKLFWLFPKKDRQFIHYRKGTLITKKRYSPSAKTDSVLFSTEARLHKNQDTAADSIGNSILLYFGHEIPYKNGEGYYRSMGSKKMNTDTFRKGVNSLLVENRRSFDLIVLSTCNNGSPDMVHALQPVTRYLLASPQNLHLSHIDTEGLIMLQKNPWADPGKVAEKLSEKTYERLTNTVQTVISLSIYDMQKIDSYIHRVESIYRNYLNRGSAAGPGSENIDCSDLSIFNNNIAFSKGVNSRYRSPRFGRKALRKTHSGWGCKEEKP